MDEALHKFSLNTSPLHIPDIKFVASVVYKDEVSVLIFSLQTYNHLHFTTLILLLRGTGILSNPYENFTL